MGITLDSDTSSQYSITLNNDTKDQQDGVVAQLADAKTFLLHFWPSQAANMSCNSAIGLKCFCAAVNYKRNCVVTPL